jgi:ribosomal protein S18 acetylase RimI-like enzyme
MTISTRSIEEVDLVPCAEVFVMVFSNPPWNEAWDIGDVKTRLEEMYHTPGSYGVIAIDENEVLGFALGYAEQWRRGKKHFYLKEMCVLPSHQRRGIGTAIIKTLCRDLAATGAEAIYLLTARDSPAQTFYERLGFHVNAKMIMMGKYLPPK